MTDTERLTRLALARVSEPGDRDLGALVAARGAEDVLAAIRDSTLPSKRLGGYRARLPTVNPERDLAIGADLGARYVVPGDLEWPTQLDDLGDARPIGLWVRGQGDLRLSALKSVAVVGSREATGSGKHVATDLSATLAERGWTVVSGAAFGIDAAAHRGALVVGGLTVAVLACGIDRIYPIGNESLLLRIHDEGLVVSELPPGCPPARFRFLDRNRVIAALTRGTVVVEAARRSGALNTANAATHLARQVMGVPGLVTSPLSAGVHALIRERAGVLVTSADDVIEQVGLLGDDLAPVHDGPHDPRDGLDPTTTRVLEAIPPRRGIDPQTISRTAGVAADAVLGCVGGLLVLGLVEQDADGRYRLARRTSSGPPRERGPPTGHSGRTSWPFAGWGPPIASSGREQGRSGELRPTTANPFRGG